MMAEEDPTHQSSPLNPTAPPFTMPSGTEATNGSSPQPNQPKQEQSEKVHAKNAGPAGAGGTNPTGAELKKLKAAEKAARRAEKVAQKGEQTKQEQKQQQHQQGSGQVQQGDKGAVKEKQSSQQGKKEEFHHKRTGSRSQPLAIRRQSVVAEKPAILDKEEVKHVAIVSHLYPRGPKASLASAGREIHPAVLALGLQLRDYVICGSNARCVAMLLVFKRVIQSYTTPAGVALSRHLTSHLGHQISYINTARTLGVAQGNAIRWLKKLISTLDPDLAEGDAKKILCQSIDAFIREKVVLADEVISKDAGSRIDDGDVVITYGKSSVVEKTLKEAWQDGRRFKTIVVDSRPLFEGKNLARGLISQGLEVEYASLTSLGEVVKGATKCILGASAMLGNGRLQSRSGTAMVALMCKEVARCPVIVLCESVKFTGKVALDSVVINELGDVDALVEQDRVRVLTTRVAPTEKQPQPAKGGKKGKEDEEQEKKAKRGLEGWKEQQNLNLLSLMYDITPSEYIDIVVCELGSLPPSAVPVVNGVHGGDE
ncbi:hypothetical protein DV738_g5228, partial [Chaetothyriales sp. CBS 135597]